MNKNVTVVDFETYYSKKDGISATNLGNANYASKADAYIVSIVADDVRWCGEIPEAFTRFGPDFWTDPNRLFVAANSNFDRTFASKYVGRELPEWHCVLDRAKFSQLPGNLAKVVGQVFKRKVDKTLRDEMDGVRYESLPPERRAELIAYCLNDSVEEKALWHALPEMTPVEEQIAAYTRMTNRRGVAINTDLVDADVKRLQDMRFEAFKAIPWHNTDKPLSYPALSRWCALNGLPVPASTAKTSEECDFLMTEHPQLNEVIKGLRRFRKSNTMIEKAKSLLERVHDGVLPLDLLYCGARHTRRWSSRGFNVQNLDKEPLKISEEVDVWTRRWLVPRPGKTFVILDYSQIEPRCLNWICENTDMLAAMRAGFGIYEAYALAFRGWTGSAGTLKKTDPNLYKECKNEVLGLGYGMGATKYAATAGLDPAVAAESVKRFRANNPGITGLWSRMDRMINRAIEDNDRTLALEMPTGDTLKHFHVQRDYKLLAPPEPGELPRRKATNKSFTILGDFGRESIQASLWGGVLTENMTQRMARDIMVEAVLALERAGLPVLFTSHDEVIIEADIDNKDEALAEAERIMRIAPAWAPDLPLEVEGGFAEHYTK